jgi:hypothetical protein
MKPHVAITPLTSFSPDDASGALPNKPRNTRAVMVAKPSAMRICQCGASRFICPPNPNHGFFAKFLGDFLEAVLKNQNGGIEPQMNTDGRR